MQNLINKRKWWWW